MFLIVEYNKQSVKQGSEFQDYANELLGYERTEFATLEIIKRTDWGLNWNTAIETGGDLDVDEISISFEKYLTNLHFKITRKGIYLSTNDNNPLKYASFFALNSQKWESCKAFTKFCNIWN